jgi:hypothetical protein
MDSLRGEHNDNGEIDPQDVSRGSDLFRLNCASCHNFAARKVGLWFALSVIMGIAFVLIYLFWPWQYKHTGAARCVRPFPLQEEAETSGTRHAHRTAYRHRPVRAGRKSTRTQNY